MRFRYHQPVPDFYKIENPKNPKTIIKDNILKEFIDIVIASNFVGLSKSG